MNRLVMCGVVAACIFVLCKIQLFDTVGVTKYISNIRRVINGENEKVMSSM